MSTGKILRVLDAYTHKALTHPSPVLDRLSAGLFPQRKLMLFPQRKPALEGPSVMQMSSGKFFTLESLLGQKSAIQVGQKITGSHGVYVVLKPLTEEEGKETTSGGMSTVYVVRCDSLTEAGQKGKKHDLVGKDFIAKAFLKLPTLPKLEQASQLNRFLKEMSVMQGLRGKKSVSQLVDFDYATLCLIMKRVVGDDLDVWLTQGNRATPRDACTIMIGVAEGLIEFKRILLSGKAGDVAHRDLKPGNIFVTFDETGKIIGATVIDFGIAKQLNSKETEMIGHQLMGTAGYIDPLIMPPNGFAWNASERSDAWSLGAILYELLARQPYFPVETTGDLQAYLNVFPVTHDKYLSGRYLARPDHINEKPFDTLWDLPFDCMSPDPAQRPQTFEAFKDRLVKIVDRLPKE